MKNILLSAALLLPCASFAQPSSQVAWTAEQIKFVDAGNPQKGQSLAITCSACHGEKGISAAPAYPSLAGQLPAYIYKQLQDYSDGNRQNPIMSGLAKTLSKQDAADLAAWYGSQPAAFQSSSQMAYPLAEVLVKNGNSERVLPPCEVCHGGNGKGQKIDIPALSGQNADYISTTLKAFKAGSRGNDIYSRMRTIAQALSDEEIMELGYYYQNIKR